MSKKENWKFIIQTIISILVVISTTLGVTSCMMHLPWSLPFFFLG